jgi:hypothetical protein
MLVGNKVTQLKVSRREGVAGAASSCHRELGGGRNGMSTALSRRFVAFVVAGVVLVLGAGPTRAMPPPLPPEELERRSDLVVEVRVLEVVCMDALRYGPNKEEVAAATYQARLEILGVKKGEVAVGEAAIVQWTESAFVGGQKPVAYYPGEEVLTHLVWKPDERVYSTTWWNAKYMLKGPAKGKELPKCP